MNIAIIGAGLAGLAAATRLAADRHRVQLFDKGRGPGGRLSTRRAQTPLGELRWDHGAQFFTARSDGFRAAVADWTKAGACALWTGRFVDMDGAGAAQPARDESRYVGTPGMNGIIRAMAADLDVRWATRVANIQGEPGAWRLAFEAGDSAGPFEAVLVATPAEQAVDLLEGVQPEFAAQAADARSAPCWAALLAFDAPLDPGFDGARIADHALSWVARNASKPGRDGRETWVLHASNDWSRDHLEASAETVSAALTSSFREIADVPEPVVRAAHRWRFAQVEQAAATPFAWDAGLGIGACGDWRIGPRIESAWTSGDVLAAAISTS